MSSAYSDVKSTTGSIKFDVNLDGAAEMNLNQVGLGIGKVASSANLDVEGNVIISGKLTIGSTVSHSNLHIDGTIGMSSSTYSASDNIINSSIVLVDSTSANISLNLPYAGNVTGQSLTVKRKDLTNQVWLLGGGNNIDNQAIVELPNDESILPSMSLISNGENWFVTSKSFSDLNEVASSNLLGYWRMDDGAGATVTDESLNGNDATIDDGGVDSWTEGKIDGGIFGHMAGISVPDSASVSPTSHISICSWVKLSSSDNTLDADNILAKAGNNSFRLRINATTRLLWFLVNDGAGGFQVVTSTFSIPFDEWCFVAVTVNFDTSVINMYKNSEVESFVATETGISDETGTLLLGAYVTTFERFKGSLDEIRLYNKPLTEDEVSVIYYQGR